MSSDLSRFFHRIIGNAWKSVALPRSQYESNLTTPSPSSITRMRSIIVAQNHDSDRLPLYASAIEMERLEYLPRRPLSLSKTIVNLTVQGALLMLPAMSASRDQHTFFGAAMVIAFAASFSGMFIKHSYPGVAAIVEKVGYLSFAIGFFLMTGVFFSGSLIMWIIGWLAWALTMLAFLIGCLT